MSVGFKDATGRPIEITARYALYSAPTQQSTWPGMSADICSAKTMSALPPKSDMCDANLNVRFGPKADSCSAAKGSVADSIIIFNGGQDRVRLVACRYATTYVRKSMAAAKKMPWSLGGEPDQGNARRNRSVDGAKIWVLRLWQIGRGGRQTKWVHGSGRSFSNGRFD